GSVFEFFRNTDLNANEYFLKRGEAQSGLPNRRPDVKQNIFGGSLGGPIGRDGKLGFFFFNYQGTRQSSGLSAGTIISTVLAVLPTDRSAQSLVNTFFPGNPAVNAASIDPVALKLLNFSSTQFNDPRGFLFPSGNPTNGQFSLSKAGRYTDDQFTANY